MFYNRQYIIVRILPIITLFGLLCALSPTSALYCSDYPIALCDLCPKKLTSTFVPSILR